MTSRRKSTGTFLAIAIAATMMAGHADAQQIPTMEPPAPKTIKIRGFEFDLYTPAKDLLPTPPSKRSIAGPILTDDLALTLEIEFQASSKKSTHKERSNEIAFQLAKILFANSDKTDAFMIALLERREDLAGLPFAMGADCRMSRERLNAFQDASSNVRTELNLASISFMGTITRSTLDTGPSTQYLMHYYYEKRPVSKPPKAPAKPTALEIATSFWSRNSAHGDRLLFRHDPARADLFIRTQIAALMQILAVESPEMRLGLVNYLAGITHSETTQALARMAIYSPEEKIRDAAIEELKSRPEKDYTDILVKGLRYPWPAVAQRSAEAIAGLGRKDLMPELNVVLTAADPRMPTVKMVDGKNVATVRELVKVNHLRNCMLCHAPAERNSPRSAPIASVPVPGESLPPPALYSQSSSSELTIRFDVTYLRQDFSALLPVEDAKPWPTMQRFDFLVRERKLTVDEAKEYRAKLIPRDGETSPYRQAAKAALRELSR